MKILVFLPLLFSISWNPAPTTTAIDSLQDFDRKCSTKNTVFQHGEEITYSLYYHLNPIWIKAGEVTFTVKDEGEAYRIMAVGRTVSSFEWFFAVRDVYVSIVDKKTLRPLRSERYIQEGSYTKVSIADFDHDNGLIYAKSGKSMDELENFTISMEHCTHDILSVIYFARNIEFDSISTGEFVPAHVFLDDKNYHLGFIFDGIDKKKKIKSIGKTDAYLLRPQLVDGYVFEKDTEMKIWASSDGNRLPLLIESPVSVGSVKAVLSSYKNLKYPTDFE